MIKRSGQERYLIEGGAVKSMPTIGERSTANRFQGKKTW